MSLIFKEITIKNFLSFGNCPQTIILNDKNYQIITGHNKDKGDNEEDKNGVGKSTIQQAIHYALFGKSTGNMINLPWLVNNINNKNMLVSLKFNKDGVDYEIIRGRSPNILKFLKNDEDYVSDESQGDSRETQKDIEKIIGFSDCLYNQLFNLTCQVPLFLNHNTANQKAILEQIVGIDIISKKISLLKDVIKDTKNELNNETFKYNTIKAQNENLEASINKQIEDMNIARKKWESDIINNIYNINNELEELNKVNIEEENNKLLLIEEYNKKQEENKKNKDLQMQLQSLISKLEIDINNKISELKKYENIDFEKEKEIIEYNQQIQNEKLSYQILENEYNNDCNKLKETNKNFETIFNSINEKKNILNSSSPQVCPTCGGKMNIDAYNLWKNNIEKDIATLEDKLHTCDLERIELHNKICSFVPKNFEMKKSVYSNLSQLLHDENNTKVLKESISKGLEEKEKYTNELNNIIIVDLGEKPMTYYNSKEELMNHVIKVNTLVSTLNSLKKSLESNPFEQQEKSINEMKNNMIKLDDAKINELNTLLYHQETLLKLLSNPTSYIRKTILDKSLEYLNTRIAIYLNKMGSLHDIHFNNDMSISISKMNVDYGYISSGEEGRVNMALTFAFRDVWESLNNCNVNLLFIDEIIDRLGLDEAGVDLLVNMIKEKKDKNIFMVTHNSKLINQTEDIIKLVKENDFTKII